MVKSYIIVLEEILPDKTIPQDCIQAANNFGIFPEIHAGVNGYDSLRYFKEYNIDKFLCRTIIDYPGHQGCFLSHFQLWKKCTEINEPILILEHDGLFIRPLPEDILEKFTDVLFLDPYSPYMEDYEDNITKSLSKEIEYFKPRGLYWHGVGEHLDGAYGYIIKPSAARRLVNFAVEYGAAPTDVIMGRNIVELESTTGTIVRIHRFYGNSVKENSTTENLEKFSHGINQLTDAKYIPPSYFKNLPIYKTSVQL